MAEHVELPGPWADLSQGITRQQFDNILQFKRGGVTLYLTSDPVAVLLSPESYLELKEELWQAKQALKAEFG